MKIFILLIAFSITTNATTQKWGVTGHRVVGDIAAEYLTDEAKQTIRKILGHESLAMASTWMDEIRSDPAYDYTHDWHWVTIPGGQTYTETEKNPNGDIIKTIRNIIAELKQEKLDKQQEVNKLKMLIHLVGDIHQPLHVGTGKDRGGNDTKVEWFWEPSNLHRLWDSDMIDHTKLSYTELSDAINHPTEEQIRKWQNSDVLDWAYESMKLRDKVYDLPEDKELAYEYVYKHFDMVEKRLLQAGVRLAGVLNEIYGK